jgi:RHS repeat-associated protein
MLIRRSSSKPTTGGNGAMVRSALCASVVHFSRSRFTGKERDTESGNDYFGARYYASSMGRWMSPDWSKTPEGVPYAKSYPNLPFSLRVGITSLHSAQSHNGLDCRWRSTGSNKKHSLIAESEQAVTMNLNFHTRYAPWAYCTAATNSAATSHDARKQTDASSPRQF